MAKTTYTIPTTDIVITARNKREDFLAWSVVHDITFLAGEYYSDNAVGEALRRDMWGMQMFQALEGKCDAMRYMDMLDDVVSRFDLYDIVCKLVREAKNNGEA